MSVEKDNDGVSGLMLTGWAHKLIAQSIRPATYRLPIVKVDQNVCLFGFSVAE